MDIAPLATETAAFLAPLIPYLLQGTEEAVKEVGKRFGSDVWDKATALWQRLRPAQDLERAAEKIAALPADPDAEAAFRLELKSLLSADSALALEVQQLLGQAQQTASYHAVVHGDGAIAQGPGAVAAGEGGVAVGRDVEGGINIGHSRRGRRPDD